MNNIRLSNSLDPDQARRFVGPDLCQNCLQRLSADDKIRTEKYTCINKYSILWVYRLVRVIVGAV